MGTFSFRYDSHLENITDSENQLSWYSSIFSNVSVCVGMGVRITETFTHPGIYCQQLCQQLVSDKIDLAIPSTKVLYKSFRKDKIKIYKRYVLH
jgi:hypothetical protein